MKKQAFVFFIVFLISAFFSVSLAAEPLDDIKEFLELDQEEDIPSSKKIVWFPETSGKLSITWALAAPFRKDLRSTSPAEQLIFSYDARELRIDAGLQYQANQFDFATHLYYMPTIHDFCQVGIGINYHYYRYFKEFSERDVIGTFRFRWIRGPVFSFELGAGYLYKVASIDAVREYTSNIYNFSYNFDLITSWQFTPAFDFWCGLKLQDYFDYPLALSPIYKLGMDFQCNPDITFGIDGSFKFIDMFFSAVYLNEAKLRLSLKVAI